MAIFDRFMLCPTAMLVIAVVWLEMVLIGEEEYVADMLLSADDCLEKVMRSGRDQTCTLESSEPERMKLFVGSTTRDVTGCRWVAGVITCLPVQI